MIVVTALIGPADELAPPKYPGRYVCVSDRAVDGWGRWPVPTGESRLAARRAKMSVHDWFPGEVTVWLDASFDLLVDPAIIVADAAKLNCPVVGFRHPDRHRVRDEAGVVVQHAMALRSTVERQMAVYRNEGFDTDVNPQRALTTTGLLVRWPAAEQFTHCWLAQIETFSLRDQLSVDYCAWRTDTPIGYLPGHYRDNAYVRYDRIRHRQGRA